MNVFLNNEAISLPNNITLETLVVEMQQLQARGIAVAVNNAVVFRSQWAQYQLHENDKVTIIKAAQGG